MYVFATLFVGGQHQHIATVRHPHLDHHLAGVTVDESHHLRSDERR